MWKVLKLFLAGWLWYNGVVVLHHIITDRIPVTSVTAPIPLLCMVVGYYILTLGRR